MTDSTSNSKLKYYLRISSILLIISTFVALLLATVNYITEDKIEENRMLALKTAINEIFAGADEPQEVNGTYNITVPVSKLYYIKKDGELIGYCACVMPKGFGGNIEMIVGIDLNGVVSGIKIISHNETPGLGSRAVTDEYLNNYKNKKNKLSLGADIDAVAGATITSKAVLSGVNAVLAITGLVNNENAENQQETDNTEETAETLETDVTETEFNDIKSIENGGEG